MSFEQDINYQLNKHPKIKKTVKFIYQKMMYAISPKIKSEGNIIIISPCDSEYEFFFGYYDKSPWDATDRYMLCLRVKCTWKEVAPKEPAEIVLFDTEDNNSMQILGTTHSWNVQQGCMLQWMGPDFKDTILYNDYRNGFYCSVSLNLQTRNEKVFPVPIYSVAQNGFYALTLDFSRLHRLRKGYGYSNLPDTTKGELVPDSPCIWKLDFQSSKVSSILKYTDLYNFETRDEMKGAEHKVNHIMISPDANRFMVLHRWIFHDRKFSRLVTCDIDGSDLYNLSDDDMVSHCNWKNNQVIIAYENKKGMGPGYYLMKDKSPEYKRIWSELDCDGHPSYSPDGSLVVTDSYADRARMQRLFCMADDGSKKIISRVFEPFKYDNDVRCDLHPRWNRAGTKICFDSVFSGKRTLCIIEI